MLEAQQEGKMSRKGGRTFSCFKFLEHSGFLQEYNCPGVNLYLVVGVMKMIIMCNGPGIQCKLGKQYLFSSETHLVDSAVRGGKRLCRLSKHTLIMITAGITSILQGGKDFTAGKT